MKIQCIDQGVHEYITVDKIYEVIEENKDVESFLIANDIDDNFWYESRLFVKVEVIPVRSPNCTKCGEYNSYQAGPFICYRCRS